jgi:hypothetical protein
MKTADPSIKTRKMELSRFVGIYFQIPSGRKICLLRLGCWAGFFTGDVILQCFRLFSLEGLLSKPEQHGADMGEQTYSCYWYDRSKDRYRHVMLNEYGDWVRYNTDDSAMKIYSWLRKLVTH